MNDNTAAQAGRWAGHKEVTIARIGTSIIVATAGLAALSWEVLWQLKASLSLGISAHGTAFTLAVAMSGMTIGSLVAGRLLSEHAPTAPLKIYAGLELLIGVSGLCLSNGFSALEWTDSRLYGISPLLAPFVHLVGLSVLLGIPTIVMGATIPVIGLVARKQGSSIARLYALNTGGAAVGVLLMAFVLVPNLGVQMAARIVAGMNVVVALGAMLLPSHKALDSEAAPPRRRRPKSARGDTSWTFAVVVVFVTGFATFALEVAWFRSMRAAFLSTTKSFAIILASVLLPLAVSARFAPLLHRRGFSLKPILIMAGVAVLVATPLVERMDLLTMALNASTHTKMLLFWYGISLFVIGPAIFLLGTALPWLLHEQSDARRWGQLYAINTLGAVVGSLTAAWVLLPSIGFARTSWLVGSCVGIVAVVAVPKRARWAGAAALIAAFSIAMVFESGLGRLRVQGKVSRYNVVAYCEGPDATVSVIESRTARRVRELIIDGCAAASEHSASDYMSWMGTLPMIAHPDPKRALVICFGTGQTANAVRREGPESVDVVELSPAVYRMARYFKSNEGVLHDTRVRSIVMDGRAWLRRCSETYDVVTLEPMPPYFATSNALYSREFYELIESRLNSEGLVAQWVPFHMLPPFYAASIAATFREVFPDAILWLEPRTGTGILVGRREGSNPVWDWPGANRQRLEDRLSVNALSASVALNRVGLTRYGTMGEVITDDNQLLSYGDVWRGMFSLGPSATRINLSLVQKYAAQQTLIAPRQADVHAADR
jgi:spermidine synthase